MVSMVPVRLAATNANPCWISTAVTRRGNAFDAATMSANSLPLITPSHWA